MTVPLSGVVVVSPAPDKVTVTPQSTAVVTGAGIPGPEGPAGPQGEIGAVGPQGEIGPQGATGPQGEIGPQGPTGATGAQGTGLQIVDVVANYAALPTSLGSGDAGDAYIVESDGLVYFWNGTAFPANGDGFELQGAEGPQGAEGIQGPKGDTGDTGPQGPQGETGEQGPQGVAGSTGATGATGSAGPKGDKGDTGDTGPAGPSTWAGITDKPPTFTPSAHNHAASDVNSGTLDVARLPVGTSSTTVAAGNDSRITSAVPNTRTVSAGTGLSGGGDLSANRSFAVSYGTAAGTACQGNDSRLSDTRTPTDNTVTSAKIVDGTIATGDIADSAITSAKIVDGTIVNADINASAAIAKTKLASDVQTSLGKADTAVQPATSGSVVVGTLPGSGVTGVLYVVP